MTYPWTRYRFVTDSDDCRPVKFPPPGPWWCSGYDTEDRAYIITFLPRDTDLFEFWPEAQQIESESVEKIVFTDRFPKPDWFEPT